MEPVIEFKDYSFKYRSQTEPTLKNIDLTIYKGEKILIAGPSGSGKSTLAHCINGLVPFSYKGDITGTLRIKGEDPEKLGIFGLSKIVGTVLQDTDGQFVGLTVAEDIAFVLENDKTATDEMKSRVKHVAEQVGLENFLSQSPTELSGGQKQRVSMAGVMIDNVDVLLFDEPLANLDPATGKRAVSLIDDLMKENDTTVIIIEHRIEDVLYRDVDRIVLVADGQIVADTTPDELLAGDLLEKNGIREPLYIAALRHAGCVITTESHPAHIETMDLTVYKEPVRDFFKSIDIKTPVKEADPVLEISDLSFSYSGKEKVLKDISFSIKKGEMLSIVGKNGAGKSTLASLICGFINPDSGMIRLNGSDISALSIKERGEHVGLVMQNPNQMISKPMIFDEVALGLKVRDVPEDEIKERVYKSLKICGLYPFRNWPVSALSFGQKKRVTIASILVMDPEIIILDEPTAGQDYRHYTEIMEFLKDLHETLGITIIMITHDMHLMLEYTDRAVVLSDGTLLLDTTPAKVLTDEEAADRAYLKKTSLYDLAVKCDIEDPSDLVNRFIYYERSLREAEIASESPAETETGEHINKEEKNTSGDIPDENTETVKNG
ncbi:MAG: ABC transporter ATP-binding protein [Lachnospiraceae bacterium]|nr:ABC transporter ATP-binding protein [Lachnospiraceae bacterium]